MFATVPSATLLGVQGRPVTVEVHVGNGLPGFTIVGLPDEACRESRDRVRAAVLSSGLAWPQRRITVNLAPSGLRKGGAVLDLPIAVGILAATGVVPADAVRHLAFLGELGLDGSIRRVPGVVPLVAALGASEVVVPAGCRDEAELVAGGPVRAVGALEPLVAVLQGRRDWPADLPGPPPPPPGAHPDLADVRGQPTARLALEVAAAGHHHLLLVGPPGSGKSMLAHRLPGLLADLPPEVALEATMVHSAAGVALPAGGLVRRPPFRAPHHTASLVAMVGGGTGALRPGEVSLAHGGCLFLDELGEFAPSVLDGLREPLEEGVIRVSRARATVELPARFLLVGAMNPCPCGLGTRPGACHCSLAGRVRYLRRLSGPLLDRFDLRLAVEPPPVDELLDDRPAEPTAAVRARVVAARQRMAARGHGPNGVVAGHLLDEVAPLRPDARAVLRDELVAGRLTGRGLHRVRRVARTLADLAGDDGPLGGPWVRAALALRADPLAGLREAVA